MLSKRTMFGFGFISLILSACSVDPKGSTLAQNAKPEDANTTVIRVRDNDLIRFVMVSSGKGFELTCKNPIGLLKLVDATGFPSTLLSNFPVRSIDSAEVQALKIDEQPKLDCEIGPRILYKSNLGGQDKYFFGEKKGVTSLFMFGCQALPEAMGFDLGKARTLDPTLIDDGVFDVSDENDINCLTGVAIGAKPKWEIGDNKQMFVAPKQKIPTFSFSVRNPNGTYAPLTVSTEGSCEWIQQTLLPSVLLINGEVPVSFRNQQCKLTVTSSIGTVNEDKRVLEFNTCAANAVLGTNGQCYTLVTRQTKDSSPADKGGVIYSPSLDMADSQTGWFTGMVDSDGVVFATKDGITWSEQYRLPGISIEDVSAVSKNVVWTVGGGGYVGLSGDGGKTWKEFKSGFSDFITHISAVDSLNAWTSSFNSIYRTVDGGKTWSKLVVGTAGGIGSIDELKFVDRNNGYVLTTSSGIIAQQTLYATHDGGVSWQVVQIPRNTAPNSVEHLTVNAVDANFIYIASSAGYIYRSEDGGLSFSQVNFGSQAGVDCLKFLDSQTGYMKTGNQLLVSGDGGRSWGQALTFNTPTFVYRCDFTDPSNGWFMVDWGVVVKVFAN